jgi:hypothetical protein
MQNQTEHRSSCIHVWFALTVQLAKPCDHVVTAIFAIDALGIFARARYAALL